MNSEIIESYVIFNGKTMPAAEWAARPSHSSGTIYDVLRVMSGVPLFVERHMERLEASARLVGRSIESIAGNIRESIYELIKINGKPDKNVKIIVYNLESSTPDYLVYFTRSSYPAPEDYKKGVHTILLHEERNNPNAKIINTGYKERVAAALSKAGAYEALLVNSKNEITEGSRSNVFFVKGNAVLTAPKGSVLIGITRVCVFELCNRLKVDLIEQPVTVQMLGEIDGLFMTGTSPKLLPIATVDDISFNSSENQLIKLLMKGYDDMLNEYINENKR